MSNTDPHNSVGEALQVAEAKYLESVKFIKVAVVVLFVLIVCLKVVEASNGVLIFFIVSYLFGILLTLFGVYHNHQQVMGLRREMALTEAQNSNFHTPTKSNPRTDGYTPPKGSSQKDHKPPGQGRNRGQAHSLQRTNNIVEEQREAELQELEKKIRDRHPKPYGEAFDNTLTPPLPQRVTSNDVADELGPPAANPTLASGVERKSMNALRTIPRREQKEWVNLMFEVGPHHPANAPDYPLTFPLPFTMRHDITSGFLYVVYQSEVIGYGKVGRIEHHEGSTVGGTDEPMEAGDNVILDGPLVRMPFPLKYQGFQGIRYTEQNLHEAKP